MPGPYSPHLVYGYIRDSLSRVLPNLKFQVVTSVGNKDYSTNSDGIYLIDLSEIGYAEGETVTINATDKFNNETIAHKFVVTGFFTEDETVTLELRTTVQNDSEQGRLNVPRSVGKEPITSDNPLSVTQDNTQIFEERRSYNGNGQVEYIGEAVPGSKDAKPVWRIHKRTYEANRLTKIAWANFNAGYDKIWDDRTTYDYR